MTSSLLEEKDLDDRSSCARNDKRRDREAIPLSSLTNGRQRHRDIYIGYIIYIFIERERETTGIRKD